MPVFISFLLVGIFLIIYRFTNGFDITCPHSPHRILRAKGVCNKATLSKYSCLYDENLEQHVESCTTEPDHVRPGQKYVITGRRRNVNCSTARYQPFIFWSNVSSQCAFQRSKCNEQGQVLYNNGTLVKDRLCRCDYTNGFAFLTEPKHRCYCILSEEDCTCYKMQCSGKLTSDYQCPKNNSRTYTHCPPIIKLKEDETIFKKDYIIEENDSNGLSRLFEIVVLIVGIVLAGFIGILTLLCYFEKDSPADLTADIEGHGLKLSWNQSMFKGKKFIKNYKILCNGETVISDLPPETSSHVIPDVLPSTTYTLKVILCTTNGMEKDSTDICYKTPDADCPDELRVTIAFGGIILSWDPPAFPGKKSIKNYKVLCVTCSVKEVRTVTDVDRGTSSHLIPHVLPSTTYKLKVIVCTINGMEKGSNDFSYRTPGPESPTNLTGDIEAGGIRLSWIQPTFPVQKLIANYKIVCNEEEVMSAVPPGTSSCIIPDVVPSTTYTLKVIVCTINDIQTDSKEFCYPTPDPQIPADLQGNIEDGGIRLTWIPPTFPGQKFIKNYKIVCNGEEVMSAVPRGTSSLVIPDVLPSTRYRLKVILCTVNGMQTDSTEFSYRTPGPDSPGNLSATCKADSINLSWKPPSFPGKQCIKHYTVILDGQEWLEVLSHRTACQIHNVKPLTTYRLNVATCTTNGLQQKSDKDYEYRTTDFKYAEETVQHPIVNKGLPFENDTSDGESWSQHVPRSNNSKQQQHSQNQIQSPKTTKRETKVAKDDSLNEVDECSYIFLDF